MSRSVAQVVAAAAGFALVSFAGLPAAAQTGAVVTTAPGDLDVGPDDEVVVREYVVRRAPSRVVYQEDVRLRPGSVVPGYVDLLPMADIASGAAVGAGRLTRMAYFVSPDDKIVVVDPATRTVVRILDR